jgi:hypothetical protein
VKSKATVLGSFILLFAATAHAAPADPNVDQEHGEVEHMRVGAVGSVGFPRPLGIEGLVKVEQRVAIGLEYSVLPTMTFSGVDTQLWALAADVRIFPGGGPFFLGARAGRQHLSATATVSDPSFGSYTGGIVDDTWFINPRVGFLWTSRIGLTLGMDVGVQLPVGVSETNTIPAPAQSSVDTSVAEFFARKPVPTVDLLQVGMLF